MGYRRKGKVILFCMGLCLSFVFMTTQCLAGDAMWVWEKTKEALNDPCEREALIDFCKRNGIDTVFLSVQKRNPTVVDGKAPSMLIPEEYANWEILLTELHENHITAEALCGTGDWLMPMDGFLGQPDSVLRGEQRLLKEDRAYGLGIVEGIFQYQVQHRQYPLESFDAIHFDIELDTLSTQFINPRTNRRLTEQERVCWYLEFIREVKQRRLEEGFSKRDLPFNWDINMNYDADGRRRFDYKVVAGFTLDSACSSEDLSPKLAWQYIFDQLDQITFLTYNDRPRYVANGIKVELAYLDEKKDDAPMVRLSSEFQKKSRSKELDGEGFSNEDYLTYLNFRRNISSIMLNRNYFQGWAVHTYDNRNPIDGDFPQWLREKKEDPSFEYPKSVAPWDDPHEALSPWDDVPTVYSNIESFQNPVYVRLRIKAHPMWRYEGSSYGNMLGLMPIGLGYASEEMIRSSKLKDNEDWYDGLSPVPWWALGQIRWWTIPSGAKEILIRNNIVWENPATLDDPDQGIERNIILEEGERYRLLLRYMSSTKDWGLLSKEIHGIKHQDNAPEHPMVVTMYLGEMVTTVTGLKDAETPHPDSSFVISDNDGDGLLDAEEIMYGTDPFLSDTDGDGWTDQWELRSDQNPLGGQIYVTISSTAWSQEFMSQFHENQWGMHGFAMTSQHSQIPDRISFPLPWSQIDVLSFRFPKRLDVSGEDLIVRGHDDHVYEWKDFQYDPWTRTARWVLQESFRNDRLTISLFDSASLRRRIFAFDVLVGDGDGNGRVNIMDGLGIRTRLFQEKGMSGYSPLFDFNGSGTIDISDALLLRGMLFQSLPPHDISQAVMTHLDDPTE